MVARRPEANAHAPRFVVFGGSLVSDWDNPVATSARALLDELARLGHDVTYLEPRGNEAVLGLLRRHGSHALRAFAARYTGFQHRTYDLSRGWERTVWFGREVATADVVIALPGIPPALLPELQALPAARPLTVADASLPRGVGAVRLTRVDEDAGEGDIPFGPALSLHPGGTRAEELLIVAYDDVPSALEAVAACQGLAFTHVVAGRAELPGWSFVPEVELPARYAAARAAIVAGAGHGAWAEARRLLPLASGCPVLELRSPADLTEQLRSARPARLPARFDARLQAETIIAAAHARLHSRASG